MTPRARRAEADVPSTKLKAAHHGRLKWAVKARRAYTHKKEEELEAVSPFWVITEERKRKGKAASI